MQFSCIENTVNMFQEKHEQTMQPSCRRQPEFHSCKVHKTKITMTNFARTNINLFAFENVSVHSLASLSDSKDTLDSLHFALCPEALWLPMPLRKWSLLRENYIQFGWGENRGLNSSFLNKGFLKWKKFSSSRLSGWADIRGKRKSYSHCKLLMESLVQS